MIKTILVVCVGNICRSPFGERKLKQLFPKKRVLSAGIQALVGYPADSMACDIAQQYDCSLTGHYAQQLTTELCQQADLILVMEKSHIEAVSRICPASRGKTMLFGHWHEQREIPDPYRRSQEFFIQVFDLIQQCSTDWIKKLS